MSILIIAIMIISAWHAIFEGIVAPTIRVRLRFLMFEIRDELRKLKIDRGNQFGDKAFMMMEESVNNVIRLMAKITITKVISAQRVLAGDESLTKSVEARIALLDSCKIDQLQDLRRRSANVFMWAFLVNSAGWAIYLIPVAFFWQLSRQARDSLRGLMSLPVNRVDQVFDGAAGIA